jgi:hypothetical protein
MLAGNRRMIRIEEVFSRQSENHFVQEILMGMPEAAAGVGTA